MPFLKKKVICVCLNRKKLLTQRTELIVKSWLSWQTIHLPIFSIFKSPLSLSIAEMKFLNDIKLCSQCAQFQKVLICVDDDFCSITLLSIKFTFYFWYVLRSLEPILGVYYVWLIWNTWSDHLCLNLVAIMMSILFITINKIDHYDDFVACNY